MGAVSALPTPEYAAHVSPALVRMRRAGSGKVRNSVPAEQEGPAVAQPAQGPAPEPSETSPAYELVVLRQDGARPVKLEAVRVLTSAKKVQVPNAPAMSADVTTHLFACRDGTATAQVRFEPGEDCPLRPVWRVRDISSAADLQALQDEAARAIASPAPADFAPQIKQLSDAVRAETSPLFARS